MRLVFLGGVFPKTQLNFVFANSSGVIQNAADALQKNLIIGFDKNSSTGILVINLPFIGSYPSRFRTPFFPGVREAIGEKSAIIGVKFLNLAVIKLFSRLFSAARALKSLGGDSETILFIYSAHIPFIIAALFFRRITPLVKICLIIPDLPDHMGGVGFWHSIFKKIDVTFFYSIVKRIDYFVVLTEMMIGRLNVDAKRAIVIEGIAPDQPENMKAIAQVPRSFLYTGTLARRYGIVQLIDAFEKVDDRAAELWICGEGDSRDYVISAAIRDKRIRYFGQIERSEVILLQNKAMILVNPRAPDGEFTKYSFPSKIMEYMVSGRPVIMYQLDGIPKDYIPYYISPIDVGVDSLALCMKSTLEMSVDKLNEIGNQAKKFVLAEKIRLHRQEKY